MLLEILRQKSIKTIELGLHEKIATKDLLEEIRDILFRYPGECSVNIRMELLHGRPVTIATNTHYKVLPCDEMLCEIESLTGRKIVLGYESANSTGTFAS